MSSSGANCPAGTRPRVVVALSGGVDSSVAAALLNAEQYDVVGVTLRLRKCQQAVDSRSCCGVDGIARAQAVAGRLGIPHYVVDCIDEFEAQVLRPAWDEYARGRTPSPCLLCNERIKFGTLVSWAQRVGAAFLATGHYARIARGADGTLQLLRGMDPAKDQSYFLAGLQLGQLESLLFPLGHRSKHEVREVARSLDLPTAAAPESQDACLVGAGQCFAEMLRQRFDAPAVSGPVVDQDGQCVGRHAGIHLFTVGQRKGLPGPSHLKRFVTAVRAEDATIQVSTREQDLDGTRFTATGVNWLDPTCCAPQGRCRVQVRYRHAPVFARVALTSPDCVAVELETPVRAVTPGQAAVFFADNRVLGRGWIHVDT